MTTQFAFLVYFGQNSIKQLGYFYIFAYLCSDISHGRILHSLVVGNGQPKLGGLAIGKAFVIFSHYYCSESLCP